MSQVPRAGLQTSPRRGKCHDTRRYSGADLAHHAGLEGRVQRIQPHPRSGQACTRVLAQGPQSLECQFGLQGALGGELFVQGAHLLSQYSPHTPLD